MNLPTPPSSSDVLLANWAIITFILVFIFSVIAGCLLLIWRKVKNELPFLKGFRDVIEQITGSPEKTVEGANGRRIVTEEFRPGMMAMVMELKESQQKQSESLVRLESVQEAQGAKLEIVRHEVEHNGGGSIKDAMKRTEDDVTLVKSDVKSIGGIVHDMSAKVENLADLLGSKIKPILSLEATINHNTTTTSAELPILEER
jgi:hypothetical protein